MNDLMSGGMHRLWKERFVNRVKPRAGEHILDMAGGTGDIAFRMAARGASVTVSDINADMLAVGRERAAAKKIDGLTWKQENAEKLSFADVQFRRLHHRLRYPERHRHPCRSARRASRA